MDEIYKYGKGCLSVSGTRGSGKSTLIKALFRHNRVRRRLTLDVMDDYGEEHYWTAHTEQEVYDYLNTLPPPEENPDVEFSLRYVPEDMEEPDAVNVLVRWSQYLRRNVVTIEESHDSLSNRADPKEVTRFAKRSRHYEADLWTSGQRPSDIAAGIRSELHANECWYLRHAEQIDLDVMARRRGPEFADRVASLEILHALRVTPLAQEPELWKIDYHPYPRITRLK